MPALRYPLAAYAALLSGSCRPLRSMLDVHACSRTCISHESTNAEVMNS